MSASLAGDVLDIERFHLFPRPGRLAQELEAGFDAGFVGEAADGDELAEALPAVFVDQGLEDGFQGQAMERVVAHRFFAQGWLGVGAGHCNAPLPFTGEG